jgi:pyridinium-3,5-biscarboxylic acid mononucleotide sulfurtransferase
MPHRVQVFNCRSNSIALNGDPMDTEAKYASLKTIITDLQSVVVAFSGGVDSTFLLKVCVDVLGKDNVLAFIGLSPTCPDREIEAAKGLAALIGAEYLIEETSEMDDPRFVENNKSRCYFCKTHLFVKAKEIAARKGFSFVAEGSNLDDMDDFRPGRKASVEQAARSPLLEAKLTKSEIRRLSQQLLLPTHDKPYLACLSSRIPYGMPIDKDVLKKIERSENFLRDLGIQQVRVRYHGPVARIEVGDEDFEKVVANRTIISETLQTYGFLYVTLDLKGYRMGSMNISG